MNNLQIFYAYFFIPFAWSDQLQNQRGMTNLLGYETYQRCSKQMSNPESKYMNCLIKEHLLCLSPFAGI